MQDIIFDFWYHLYGNFDDACKTCKYHNCHLQFSYGFFKNSQTFNATEEIAAASSYKHIRVMSVSRVTSDVPLYDLQSIDLPWSLPSAGNIL